jgi:hypothetical protein
MQARGSAIQSETRRTASDLSARSARYADAHGSSDPQRESLRPCTTESALPYARTRPAVHGPDLSASRLVPS